MLNKLIIYLISLIFICLVPPIFGAYHHGIIGFFAGVGLSFVLFKAVMWLVRKRGIAKMTAIFEKMSAEAELLDGATVEVISLKHAHAGNTLEGDSKELLQSFPKSFELEVRISPCHDRHWQMASLNLTPDFDESILNDEDDAEVLGYGAYTYSIQSVKDGESHPLTEVSGPSIIKFHFGVGANVTAMQILAHSKSLSTISLAELFR
jgi:hypothetical protein